MPQNSPQFIAARDLARQCSLPFERKSTGRAVRVKEAVVEAETDFQLSRAGFQFLNTTTRLKRLRCQCPRCGNVFFKSPNYATGQDRGIPDRLVYAGAWFHRLLPATLWLGVELKGSHTPFSCVEQKELYEAGHTVVARAGQVALEAARQVSGFFAYIGELEESARTMITVVRSRNFTKSCQAALQTESILQVGHEKAIEAERGRVK